jgi:hypothetical protein
MEQTMRSFDATHFHSDREPRPLPLRFTPAEWRFLLEDPGFLDEPDNSYAEPRSLMGLPVLIVPDHSVG